MSIIHVPTGGRGSTDLTRNSLYTVDLEACVAVAGIFNSKGALMHLTQKNNLIEYFQWFQQQFTSAIGNFYIIGGMDGRSENFIRKIEDFSLMVASVNRYSDVLGNSM